MSIFQKIKVAFLGYKATSQSYIQEIRKRGGMVGEDVILFRPYNTTIDLQNPHLLTIGSHVMITGPVTILTHDYSWSVLKRKYGRVVGNQKPVSIGDNVFIGWGATILGGTEIGDNTVIGANSVVHGKLEGNAVYAGNPARRIMSIEEYYKKRVDNQLQEALTYVSCYEKRFGKLPEEKCLREYFFLFTNADNAETLVLFDKEMKLTGNYENTVEELRKNKPLFNSYEEFIAYYQAQKVELT